MVTNSAVTYQRRPLSPSAMNVYQQCPKRWHMRYVLHLPDPSGVDAVVGTFAHLVLEHLFGRQPSDRTPATAKAIAGAQWPAFAQGKDFVALGLDDVKPFKWRAWKAVEGLWNIEDPEKVDVVATEQRVETKIDGIPFLGLIDRVSKTREGTVVGDYKSGAVPQPKYASGKLDQVLLYVAALEASTGERPVAAHLHYITHGQSLSATINDQTVGKVTGQLKAVHDGITDGLENGFEADPGPLCPWCPYWKECAPGKAKVLELLRSGKAGHSPAAEVMVKFTPSERRRFEDAPVPDVTATPIAPPGFDADKFALRPGEQSWCADDQQPLEVWAFTFEVAKDYRRCALIEARMVDRDVAQGCSAKRLAVEAEIREKANAKERADRAAKEAKKLAKAALRVAS